MVSILTRPGGRVQRTLRRHKLRVQGCFNPHPSRRTGATVQSSCFAKSTPMFQSSPVPEDGCNHRVHEEVNRVVVSILTRPGGRVQRRRQPTAAGGGAVSILTRPGGRVQRASRCPRKSGRASFNPHPSRRTGATVMVSFCRGLRRRFQSSPVPEDGCN